MSCKWNGSGQPRILPGRHNDDCADETCKGCQACVEGHCRVCGVTHGPGTCPECLAAVRADLREIARMCDALPDEVQHRGVNGEAMVLLGPTADTEARGHLEASVACGRVPAEYLEVADDDRHPLSVLGGWVMTWQDALDHEDNARITIPHAVDYLDRTLAYMGGYEHVSFEDFAKKLRQCVSHLESVLLDGERDIISEDVRCLKHYEPVRRRMVKDGYEDEWFCHRCHQNLTWAEYQMAAAEALRQELGIAR